MMRVLFLSIATIMALWLVFGVCTVSEKTVYLPIKPQYGQLVSKKDILASYEARLPSFKHCNKNESVREILNKRCSEEHLVQFISDHLNFGKPHCTKCNGTIVLKLFFDENGKIDRWEYLKNPCECLSDDIDNMIRQMPDWEYVPDGSHIKDNMSFVLPIKLKI